MPGCIKAWLAQRGTAREACLYCRYVGAIGYAVCGVLGCSIIPLLYPACKWYMVAVVFLSSPVFSVSPSQCCTWQAELSIAGHMRA